jgi:hypothetical protein
MSCTKDLQPAVECIEHLNNALKDTITAWDTFKDRETDFFTEDSDKGLKDSLKEYRSVIERCMVELKSYHELLNDKQIRFGGMYNRVRLTTFIPFALCTQAELMHTLWKQLAHLLIMHYIMGSKVLEAQIE